MLLSFRNVLVASLLALATALYFCSFSQVVLEQSPEGERNRVVRWRGWGTGLAWWPNEVAQLSPLQQRIIMDRLFNRSTGLGLNIVRYIIPAGYNEATDPQFVYAPSHSVPGFRSHPGRPYDWSADPFQRQALLEAKRYGADIFEATAFSPPWWMTVEHTVTGTEDGSPNIDAEHLPLFAEYLADIMKQFHDAWNLTFSTLSPLNEPLDFWWHRNNSQEGCAVDQSLVLPFFQMVREALDLRGLQAMPLSGLDDWILPSIRFLNDSLVAGQDKALGLMRRLQVHGYNQPSFISPDVSRIDVYIQLRQAADQAGLEVWQSEWGPMGPVPEVVADLDIGLMMGRMISEQINFLGIVAWSHWQAVTHCYPYPCRNVTAQQWGLIRMEWPLGVAKPLFFSKQYFMTMHYTRWIRPGALVHQVIGEVGRYVVTAVDEAENRLVTVISNVFISPRRFVIPHNLTQLVCSSPPVNMSVTKYQTDWAVNYRLVSVESFNACNEDLLVTVPAKTMVSVLIQGIPGSGRSIKK